MKIRIEIEGKITGTLSYRGPDSTEAAIAYLSSIDADEVMLHLVKNDGTRADAEFSGKLAVTSATRFLISASRSEMKLQETSFPNDSPPTLRERLEMFLRHEFPTAWFSSLDVKLKYENVYGKINLSTVSTYLARMYHDNILLRRGNRNQREYRWKDEGIIIDKEHALVK